MERNDPTRNGFGLDGSTFHVHVLLYEIRMDVLHKLKRVRLVRLPRSSLSLSNLLLSHQSDRAVRSYGVVVYGHGPASQSVFRRSDTRTRLLLLLLIPPAAAIAPSH